jgi:hypothetical protein
MTQLATRGPHRLLRPRSPAEVDALADVLHELLGSWVIASPCAGYRLLRALDAAARDHDDLDRIAAALDVAAIEAGQNDAPEAAALLLDASDSIRSALERIDAATEENLTCRTD